MNEVKKHYFYILYCFNNVLIVHKSRVYRMVCGTSHFRPSYESDNDIFKMTLLWQFYSAIFINNATISNCNYIVTAQLRHHCNLTYLLKETAIERKKNRRGNITIACLENSGYRENLWMNLNRMHHNFD